MRKESLRVINREGARVACGAQRNQLKLLINCDSLVAKGNSPARDPGALTGSDPDLYLLTATPALAPSRSYLTNSPYTSASLPNKPLATNRVIVRLNQKQSHTLAFSEPLGNIVLLIFSINGNAW